MKQGADTTGYQSGSKTRQDVSVYSYVFRSKTGISCTESFSALRLLRFQAFMPHLRCSARGMVRYRADIANRASRRE